MNNKDSEKELGSSKQKLLDVALEVGRERQEQLDAISRLYREQQEKIKNMLEPYHRLKEQLDAISQSYRERIQGFVAPFVNAGKMIGKMKAEQIVFWESVTEEFMDEVIHTSDLKKLFEDYYSDDNFRKVENIIEQIRNNKRTHKFLQYFEGSIASYRQGYFATAIVSLLAFVDGLLEEAMDNKKIVAINRRAEAILDKAKGDISLEEYSPIVLYYTFTGMLETISKGSDFNGDEPDGLNRHWIVHGRCRRRFTQLDCIKIINFIYALLLMLESTEISREK